MLDHSSDLRHILQYISLLQELPEPASLKRFIDALRVTGDDEEAVNAKIRELIDILKENPEYGAGLAAFILRLTDNYQRITLYADTGIISDDSFSHSINRLIGHRFLPLLPKEDSVVELAHYLFDGATDEKWLSLITPEYWDELVELIKVDEQNLELVASAKNSILNALVILSYRISGIGLHTEMMDTYPQILNYTAAFVAQNQETVLFVNQYRQSHNLDAMTDTMPDVDIDPAPLLVMLEQCQDIVDNIRKRVYKTGISIRMTNMLVRLEQSIHRMHILLELVSDKNKNRDKAIVELTQEIVRTAKTRYSFGYLIKNNTRLLSRKITENSGQVGEHYISTDKLGYKKMYKKAAIGGFLIAFMATLKILGSSLVLAPIGKAFMNSMIYGLGFVGIHIAGGTVATKQPAMTAAAIASTISEGSSKKKQLTKLAELVVDIMRTQFIAIMGNISIAMPIALLIAFGWVQFYGEPMISTEKAAYLLHELDPLRSLSLPHAAIAGVFLFLSGLISGYYDNLAAFNKIGERVKRHHLLARLMPQSWQNRLGSFVEANLGAIMGNFIFGCFLGSTATIGYMLGLPLDIRHIAFASANLVHGLFFLSPDDLTWQLALYAFVGVLLIGMVNLIVSFSLSLMIALRSKEVHFSQWKDLGELMFKHLITHPRDFFIPRNESVKYARIDSEGRIIYDDNVKETAIPSGSVVRRLGNKKTDPLKDIQNAVNVAKTDLSQGTLDKVKVETKHSEAGEMGLDMNSETNAKNPLPKPDKPPQLPK
ncbi:site-specific recombinase [Moraxella bovis]|uniref:site-specific recombinase n=1 Tax=Moraxella bovis TaxID=476 RepID=UPI002227658F|nr:site-specific recombinase [Moraxella bovis]UYZ69449.1 site-specific recombinase [Moraxella bovis]UZA26527.1 site-specific recombinase [Moraxella bovis]UZA38943.1 site-specific recombinase [Moraxella bovis]WAJ72700.1 site-specific recombinase [Moraxella bovis]